MKEAIRKDLLKSNSTLRLWDFCLQRRVTIHNLISRDLFQLQGSTPTMATFGYQGDISNMCQYDWYQWVYYLEDGHVKFPYQREKLGRALGPYRNEGNDMVQGILNENGIVVPRRTVRPLNPQEIDSETESQKRNGFDMQIKMKLGDSMTSNIKENNNDQYDNFEVEDLINEPKEPSISTLYDDGPIVNSTLLYEKPINEILVEAESKLILNEDKDHDKIIDECDQADTTYDDTPFKHYTANRIAQNLIDRIDDD